MEEAEKRVLSQFRTRLANEIVVTTSFLSAFCEKAVIDEEMTRLVKSEDNYVAKAQKLLELLPKRGPRAFSTLVEILEITNPWLAEKLKSALHEERNRDAKLKFSSSVSESASIEGYCASSLRNIDIDIKATVQRFIKANLQHFTDADQRNIEKWLGEELQRERRKQQFRTPHTILRHPQEFQSSKEVQTDVTGMEMQELCEDLIVQLHGVDYVKMNRDLSFKMLKQQVSELLTRIHKMDFLIIQCMEKFDDSDRYTLTLPDLIDRTISDQKELLRLLMTERQEIQRLTEENDTLEGHIRRLEEDIEKLVGGRAQNGLHPQQMYLKKRRDLLARYTMTGLERTKKQTAINGAESDNAASRPGTGAAGRKSPPPSPKARVRFSTSTSNRPTTGTAHKRPSTSRAQKS